MGSGTAATRAAPQRAPPGGSGVFPLLVHAVIFGCVYSEQALEAARAALAR